MTSPNRGNLCLAGHTPRAWESESGRSRRSGDDGAEMCPAAGSSCWARRELGQSVTRRLGEDGALVVAAGSRLPDDADLISGAAIPVYGRA